MREKVFDYTRHKQLWNWLAEHPDKNKDDWPGWYDNEIQGIGLLSILHDCFGCFACDYAGNNLGHEGCRDCPLDWDDEITCVQQDLGFVDADSYYYMWYSHPEDLKLRAEMARKIANTKPKKWVKCK